jgi:hypothetical protein
LDCNFGFVLCCFKVFALTHLPFFPVGVLPGLQGFLCFKVLTHLPFFPVGVLPGLQGFLCFKVLTHLPFFPVGVLPGLQGVFIIP